MEKPISLAILISGGGSTLKNIWEHRQEIPAEISLVVSSKPAIKGTEWAKKQNLPVVEVFRKEYETTEVFSAAITRELDVIKPDLVVLGGFLNYYLIPSQYEGKVINIHPSLIPAFCGKGFYGERVHQAVLDRGVQFSGCTVHFADNKYDHGPIILQRVVAVKPEDTVVSLSQRVFKEECEAYPLAIRWIHQKKLKIDGNKVVLSQ